MDPQVKLTASWIPAAVRLATTVAGSRDGSRRRELRVTGADAGLATTPEEPAAPATAAAVLLAASNKARTRSAMAASLSPIFSIVLKISPVCLDPEKLSKMRKKNLA
jgi:hypothetical protein